MGLAYPMQKFQDWFTQQWAILWGKKIDPKDFPWLIGPFGNLNGIGGDFINQLAEKENLIIERDSDSKGLIPSIEMLNFQISSYPTYPKRSSASMKIQLNTTCTLA